MGASRPSEVLRAVFIRWLILIVVGWLLSRLLLRPARARTTPRQQPNPAPASPFGRPERLVEDPVCGLRIPESSAVRAGDLYFCSDACRDQHLARTGS